MGTFRDAVLVTAAAVTAAAAVAVAIPRSTYPSAADRDVPSASVSVTARSDDLAESATVLLEWAPGRDVRLRGSAGTVTSVFAEVGEDVECGRPLIQVDGRNLVSYCAAAPLYRTIEPGLEGNDIDELIDFLMSTGHLTATEPDPGQMATAIDALRVDIGLDVTGQLAPADTIWVGQSAHVGSIDLQVGDVVVGDESVLRVDPQLLAARLPAPPPSGRVWLFGLEGSSARTHVDASGAVIELDALADQVLMVADGDELPSSIAGSIRLQAPIEVIGVPASAIVTNGADLCVIAVDADLTRAVPVDVIGSSVGVAFVDAELRPGQAIQAQPTADQAC
jgi:hypothetical protein